MPLPKRMIQPVMVARNTIPENYPLPNELEAVTNGTLANAVRQLSSLSQHAEDLFGELARDAQQLHDRSNSLQARIDRLAIKVTQLDSTVEEVSLQDIHKRKAFRSSNSFDQQIFSKNTMPSAMLEIYHCCDKPPPLDKLNCYRDDGKDGLKFYTDPNYFFELWKQEMMQDMKAMQGKKPHRARSSQNPESGRRQKKPVKPITGKTIDRQIQLAYSRGEHIQGYANMDTKYKEVHYRHPHMDDPNMMDRPNRPNSIEIRRSYQHEMVDGMHTPGYSQYEEHTQYSQEMYMQNPMSNEVIYQPGTPTRKIRPSQPPPAPPSNQTTPTANTPTRMRGASMGRDNLPPPPPPPENPMSPPNGIPPHLMRQSSQSRSNSPHSHQGTPEPIQDLPPPPPIPKQVSNSPPKQVTPAVAAPPPPPPPPMPSQNGPASPPPPLMNGDLLRALNSNSPPKLTPPKERVISRPPIQDPRNDLLKAIRDGIKLRKVEKIEQKEVERGNGFHDVASILARRVAVEFSDSDSASDSEDSEAWGENETSA